MKKSFAEFFAKCRDWSRGAANQTPEQAEFEEMFRDALKHVKVYKADIAYDMACDLQKETHRQRQFDIEAALERKERTERFMEAGKSYTPPAVERGREKGEPDLEPN